MATIDKSLAAGLRKSYARDTAKDVSQQVDAALNSAKPHMWGIQSAAKKLNTLCAEHPRRPSSGSGAGTDIVYIDCSKARGVLLFILDKVNKNGLHTVGVPGRLLLSVSQHGVESLYQRLRTTEWDVVMNELRPVGAWLLENSHIVAMEEEGYLSTPTGVFPILRGAKKLSKQLDGRSYWLATTWISQANLEDHTPHKRRVAEAVRAVSGKGVQFVKI